MYRVLIVEDEAVIRKGLIATFDWLSANCIVVGEAENGVEGLEKIRALQPDLIIADISMPGMNGLDMLEQAQESCNFQAILLTGYSEFEYARRAVSLHAAAYLTKPVNKQELMTTILSLSREEKIKKKSLKMPSFISFDVISEKKMNYYVRSTLEYIRANYYQQIQVETLASSLNVSKSYLSRKLQEETSHTFTELLFQCRIQHALELLNSGKYRINEVAAMTGFHDYKHFNSVFKKILNMTPSEYMNSSQRIVFRVDMKSEKEE